VDLRKRRKGKKGKNFSSKRTPSRGIGRGKNGHHNSLNIRNGEKGGGRKREGKGFKLLISLLQDTCLWRKAK